MSLTVLTIQILLPVFMLVWLGSFPARGWLAYGLQTLSVALVLLGLGLVSLWAMPPFWTPYLYGLVLAVLVVWHIIRGGISSQVLWSVGPFSTVLIVLAMGLGVAAGYLSTLVLQGSRPPAVETVDIAPPFGPGTYLIAHGGSTEIVNAHLHTLDSSVERFRAWRGQSRALDIFKTTRLGLHMDGWWPADPTRYETFGAPVLSPCGGPIARVENDVPDSQVPQMDRANMAGNYVAVNCGNFFVILAHLRRGSVRGKQGNVVETGDLLGEMGNSGNSSEPHLHIHAQRGLPDNAPLGGEPLGLTINSKFLIRNDRLTVIAP